jgi:hypothetical protein
MRLTYTWNRVKNSLHLVRLYDVISLLDYCTLQLAERTTINQPNKQEIFWRYANWCIYSDNNMIKLVHLLQCWHSLVGLS